MNSQKDVRNALDSSKTRPNFHGALTIDLEDWKNALNPRPTRKHTEIDESYVRVSTKRILSILEEFETKATFFVLGEVALRIPDVVEEIYRCGHEIASHSPIHVPPRTIPRDRFVSLVKRDISHLREITGEHPRGFRSPYFAIRRHEGWLLRALSDLGFWYDSSVVPSWTPLYGIPSAPKVPYFPDYEDISKSKPTGSLLELPITVWPTFKSMPAMPIGGGFFMRAWPAKVYLTVLDRVARKGRPMILYVHPGDLDPKKEISDLPIDDKIVQYLGTKNSLQTFKALLSKFRLTTVAAAFSTELKTLDR